MSDIFVSAACMSCVVGLHHECYEPEPVDEFGAIWQCCCWSNPDSDAQSFIDGERSVGRPVAGVGEITDVLSTGRKRAEMLAVIFPGMLCDWAGLRYAGGGPHPIVGCQGNRIADVKRNADLPPNADRRGERHHGPDKNVLNNAVGVNLHRVCSACHQHWHTMNDQYYGERPKPDEQHLPLDEYENFRHDPDTLATPEELALSDEWWGTRTEQRKGAYPLAPPDKVR